MNKLEAISWDIIDDERGYYESLINEFVDGSEK